MEFEKVFQRWAIGGAQIWDEVEPIIAQTCVAPIDMEHRRLVMYCLELNRALGSLERNGLTYRGIQQACGLLEELRAYADFHFSDEESIMERFRIPGQDPMHLHHQDILLKIRLHQDDFASGRGFIGMTMQTDILDWIIEHINRIDYHTFALQKLVPVLVNARTWTEIAPFVKETQINAIDEDHRAIIEVLLELNEAELDRRTDRFRSLYERLKAVTRDHFIREEALLADYRRGAMPGHRKLHRAFLDKLDRLDPGDAAGFLGFRAELVAWLAGHINHEDVEVFHPGPWYANLLREARTADIMLGFLAPTGTRFIDEDHQEFLVRVFEISTILQEETSPPEKTEKIGKVLDWACEFAKGHFSREELHMERMEHPLLRKHKDEHDALLLAFIEFRRNLADGLLEVGPNLKERLFSWWLHHVNSTDIETFRKYL